MDRVVISKTCRDALTIDKDSYVIINSDVQAKNIEFNIMNCKVTIVDISSVENKSVNCVNSVATLIDIMSNSKANSLLINNDNSNIEYNIIDLHDDHVKYDIKENCVTLGGNTTINVASVCYKDKNKNYIINTVNEVSNTFNEINCFGIVKGNSVLNYDVTSLIKKGAKKSVVRQNSNILLFDEVSLGKNNPILLIEENDVKASHGSSIGKIDDDTMFYLCSRGLTKNEATNLICLGKMEYLIKKIEDKDIKESLVNNFKERMG